MKTFAEALEWLYAAQPFGIRLGLEPMLRLVEGLRLNGIPLAHAPRRSSTRTSAGSPAPAPCWIHVAGTNGKGSVCAFLASIGKAAGLRTGLYTSPHLLSFRERIQIQNTPISEHDALQGLTRIRSVVETWPTPPTFFELVTALALLHFQNHPLDLVILETGLGGRLDATNIVLPEVSVITPIGMDHCQILGSTLPEIAREKAGIFKSGRPVVCAPQTPEVEQTLRAEAHRRDCPFECIRHPWTVSPLGLVGSHQQWNAALAVRSLQTARLPISEKAIVDGLAQVHWPGRFQILNPTLVLDGAHNPPSARVLAQTWLEAFPNEKACVIFGAMADKAVAEILSELTPIAAEWALVPVSNPRALPLAELQRLVHSVSPGVLCQSFASVQEALGSPSRSRRLVCGSLFLIGETLALLEDAPQEMSTQ